MDMRSDCVRFLSGIAALAAARSAGALAWGLLTISLPATFAQEFEVPKGSVSFEDTCTLEGVQEGYMQIRDSKTELWALRVHRVRDHPRHRCQPARRGGRGAHQHQRGGAVGDATSA